jgi:hypothetical protein
MKDPVRKIREDILDFDRPTSVQWFSQTAIGPLKAHKSERLLALCPAWSQSLFTPFDLEGIVEN